MSSFMMKHLRFWDTKAWEPVLPFCLLASSLGLLIFCSGYKLCLCCFTIFIRFMCYMFWVEDHVRFWKASLTCGCCSCGLWTVKGTRSSRLSLHSNRYCSSIWVFGKINLHSLCLEAFFLLFWCVGGHRNTESKTVSGSSHIYNRSV